MAKPKKSKSPTKAQRPAAASPKPTPPVAVKVPINAKLKAAWDKQAAIIKHATHEDMRFWDAKYEAVATIAEHNPPLYLAGGFATFPEFVADFLQEDARQVRDWMLVAKNASPDEEAQYTVTKLALLLSLLRVVSKEGSLPKNIDWKRLKVPFIDAEGKVSQRIGVTMTPDEIRQTRRMFRQKNEGGTVNAHARDGAEVQAIRATFSTDTLRSITVKYQDGKFWFGAVPGYALGDFLKAVGAAKWEAADDKVEKSVKSAKKKAKKARKK